MLSLILAGPLMWAAAENVPTPVILDTDIGDDIDDTWALAMLLGCPAADVKLIVTASDDTPTKTRLVAKMLDAMGRTDIPIGTGVKTSDQPIHQKAWLGNYSMKTYPGKAYEDGVQAMIDAITRLDQPGASPKPVLLVIGPQTNLQEALRREPTIAEKVRVVTMAGSIHIGYGGKKGRDPEYNVVKNIAAARAVFAASWDITLAPLDVCGTLILKGERYARVNASTSARARVVMENYAGWANRKNYPENESSVLFDTVAAYLAFEEALCKMETVKLSIDDRGATVPDEQGRSVRCALDWKDREAFEELLVNALCR